MKTLLYGTTVANGLASIPRADCPAMFNATDSGLDLVRQDTVLYCKGKVDPTCDTDDALLLPL